MQSSTRMPCNKIGLGMSWALLLNPMIAGTERHAHRRNRAQLHRQENRNRISLGSMQYLLNLRIFGHKTATPLLLKMRKIP